MSSVQPGRSADPEARRFIVNFMLLSVTSGVTIGMAKLATTLYALHLGADSLQVGVISAMESAGMVLMTVPAGFLISRFGARHIYLLASMGPMLLNFLLPLTSLWYAIAATQFLIGLCIPFRIVSMNSSFLERLRQLGPGKAGWYRAAQVTGMGLLGPALASFITGRTGYAGAFVLAGILFAWMGLHGRSFLPAAAGLRKEAVAQGGVLAQIRAMLGNAVIGESLLIEFISSATATQFSTFIVVLAIKVLHLPREQALLLVMVQGATSVVALFGFGFILRQVPRRLCYGASLFAATGGLGLLGLSPGMAGLVLGAVLLSSGAALIHLVNMTQLGSHDMDKSKIAGLYNLASMAGSFSGAMIGGLLSTLLGLRNAYLAWIPVLLIVAALCYRRSFDREAALAAP